MYPPTTLEVVSSSPYPHWLTETRLCVCVCVSVCLREIENSETYCPPVCSSDHLAVNQPHPPAAFLLGRARHIILTCLYYYYTNTPYKELTGETVSSQPVRTLAHSTCTARFLPDLRYASYCLMTVRCWKLCVFLLTCQTHSSDWLWHCILLDIVSSLNSPSLLSCLAARFLHS